MTVATATAIRLETACGDPICDRFSMPLFEQMSSGRYDVCSVLPIPASVDEWRDAHRTARKRADRAMRRHYWAHPIERHRYADDIYAINTSVPERQGRPMASGYGVRPSEQPLPDYPCARHAIRTYGVLDEHARLVAYLWLYRCGQLALVSQVLGHAHLLEDEIMWMLFQNVITYESRIDPDGFLVYNRHDSGTPGLVWFKEHLGFTAQEVEWQP